MKIFLTSDSRQGDLVVRHVLRSLEYRIDDPRSAGAGALLATHDMESDVVIAVLWASRPTQQQRSAVLVEVGIAIGRGVPVLIIAKPNLPMPFFAGLPRLIASDNQDGLLGIQIELFLEGLKSAPSRIDPIKRRVAAGPHAGLSLTAGMDFSRSVSTLLRTSNSEIVENSSRSDTRADFTLYFSGEDSDLGVVLVETTSESDSLFDVSDVMLKRTAVKLSDQVFKSGAGLGLVIFDGPLTRAVLAPMVAAVSIADLRHFLAEGSLTGFLRRVRNEAIHRR